MAKPSKAIFPLAFFALFWNGLVGTFDGILGFQLYQEFDARGRFEEVSARVLKSEVGVSYSDDSTQYAPEIQYAYEYGGMDYLSEKHSFATFRTSDDDYARDVCAEFSVGKTVTAYVDPDQPTVAVLDVSGKSFPSAVLLFLAPFNFVGLGIIALLIGAIRAPRNGSREEELRRSYVHVDTGDHIVIGKPGLKAFTVFLIGMCISTFIGIFFVIPLAGFHAPLGLVMGALAACASLSAGFAFWSRKRARSPERFLHVDRLRDTYAYPADSPAGQLSSIESITVDTKETGVTINDVRQYDHLFEAQTDSGPRPLLKVRAGKGEGEAVLELLRSELLYRSDASRAAAA